MGVVIGKYELGNGVYGVCILLCFVVVVVVACIGLYGVCTGWYDAPIGLYGVCWGLYDIVHFVIFVYFFKLNSNICWLLNF